MNKKFVLVSLVALLALMPLALAEEISTPATDTTTKVAPAVETKAVTAVKARYAPDFKSMTRYVGTKITPKKTLTRVNFKQITTSVTECRKACIDVYRESLRRCSGKSNVCPKAAKNQNNVCFDTCAIATRR